MTGLNHLQTQAATSRNGRCESLPEEEHETETLIARSGRDLGGRSRVRRPALDALAADAGWSRRMTCARVLFLCLVVLGAASHGGRNDGGRNEPQHKHTCRAATYAVLISGQVERFVWRDVAGPLIAAADRACPPAVDVYIVLQGGEAKPQFAGPKPEVPYSAVTSPANLEAWYRNRGARNVTVEYSTQRIEAYLDRVIMNVSNVLNKRFEVWRHGNERQHVVQRNLLRMLYLRHSAFAAALASGRTYTGYTYWREDNFFFAPLAETLFPSVEDPPRVVVDSNCHKWGNMTAYPDKIYTANLAGAKLLLGATEEDFVADMMMIAGIRGKNSESQLQVLLDRGGSNVTAQEFHRADVRYVAGHEGLCVAGRYARCAPDLETELNVGPGLHKCPGPNR